MPVEAKIVRLAVQDQAVCLWAEVETRNKEEVRQFRIFGTGKDIPESATYLGSFDSPPFVWHVYEVGL